MHWASWHYGHLLCGNLLYQEIMNLHCERAKTRPTWYDLCCSCSFYILSGDWETRVKDNHQSLCLFDERQTKFHWTVLLKIRRTSFNSIDSPIHLSKVPWIKNFLQSLTTSQPYLLWVVRRLKISIKRKSVMEFFRWVISSLKLDSKLLSQNFWRQCYSQVKVMPLHFDVKLSLPRNAPKNRNRHKRFIQ